MEKIHIRWFRQGQISKVQKFEIIVKNINVFFYLCKARKTNIQLFPKIGSNWVKIYWKSSIKVTQNVNIFDILIEPQLRFTWNNQ